MIRSTSTNRAWLIRFGRLALLAISALCIPTWLPSATPAAPPSPTEEEVHTQVYRRSAAAVVGIACTGKIARTGETGSFYGTGVIVSPDGLVLTTTTVVPEGAPDIRVYLIDGRILPAQIRRLDKRTEAVLLKITAPRLVAMRLADSAAGKLGDPVYSWGNPFLTIMKDGMVSLSAGSISGLYGLSSVSSQSRYLGPVLETDAALNPGSDGGPLTDADGNLLGLQMLAFSRTRWLGAVVPVHCLTAVMPELKALPMAAPVDFKGPKERVWAVKRAFGQLADALAPATVSIRVVREGDPVKLPDNRKYERLEAQTPYPDDVSRELERPKDAYASGFIVQPEGIVLTSAHNLDGQRRSAGIKTIQVFLADGTRLTAKLLGQDAYYDLAALKLEGAAGKKYPFTSLASAAGLAQGKFVAVLGRSETGGALTLNSGAVSAVGRHQGFCTQISALVNYGNLGGPVLDLRGETVGMVTRLTGSTPWRQNCGVGFMLNGETIRSLLPDLMAGRKVDRPKRAYLGVQGDEGARDIKGARIAHVASNSPAKTAGFEEGDVIVELNGIPVHDWGDLTGALLATKVGDTVKVKILRDNETLTLEVTLGEAD